MSAARRRSPSRAWPRACGLSAATLVQRFKSKAGLKQSTLLHAWDRLDEKTRRLAAEVPKTAEGAIELLVGAVQATMAASKPTPRACWCCARICAIRCCGRGARAGRMRCRKRWKNASSRPRSVPGIGLLIASQWQGSLLWWSFDPKGKVERFVEESLRRFVDTVMSSKRAGSRADGTTRKLRSRGAA